MRKKRILVSGAVAAAATLALAGCGGGGGGGEGGGDASTLTILDYYDNEPDSTLVQEALDACAETVGVEIERESVPGPDLIQTVLQRAQSKTMPDVLMLDNPDVQEIAATGGLTPLSTFDIDTSPFTQSILDAATHEGEVYGLGPAVNTLGLFYNVDVLEEAGIEPPTTWDELKESAAALTDGDRYGVAFSAIADYEGAWQFLPFMWTNGGDETELDSPENAEALQLWVDLIESGSASAGTVNWSQGDVQAKAAEFVECMSNEETSLSIAESRYLVPTRTDLIDGYIEQVPEMEAFGEQIKTARARTAQLGAEWPKAATVIYNAVQLAITGEATADEAFAKAAQG